MMASASAVSTSFLLTKSASSSSMNKMNMNHSHLKIKPPTLFPNRRMLLSSSTTRPFIVQATYSDGGRPSSASVFVGGFILGGLIVGTLGCVYAPQISKAIAGTDKEESMRKLPKFIYDEEEKILEKTRKVLANKIEQLNAAIEEISSKYRSKETLNWVPVSSDDDEIAKHHCV